MPAYLSDASKSYHQMKRIRPNDPINKLEYYVPATSSQNNRRRQHHNHNHQHQQQVKPNGQANDLPPLSSAGSSSGGDSSLSSPSSYSSKLINLIRSRELASGQFGTGDGQTLDQASQIVTSGSELDYMEAAVATANAEASVGGARTGGQRVAKTKAGHGAYFSPILSSGFSEGTLLGPTLRHHGPAAGVLLERHNMVAAGGVYQYCSSSDNASITKSSLELMTGHSTAGKNSMSGTGQAARHHQKQVRLLPPATTATTINTNNNNSNSNSNGGRSRRRKITRINRRMLNRRDGGLEGGGGESFDDYSSSPYALSELFSQSEIPGFREIFASDSYLRKFCWIVAFLFMTVLSLNDMTELITEYYEYPITVDVRLKDSARLPFPAVTVCNLNAVRFSALCSNSRFELSSQMPSEMRDKLCGIQVEKKKQNNSNTNSDSDISDINNIGITTTTTTTTTTTATTLAPGAAATTTGSSAAVSSTTTTSVGAGTTTPSEQTTEPSAEVAVGTSGPITKPVLAAWSRRHREDMLQRHWQGSSARRFRRSLEAERPFAPKKWMLKVTRPYGANQPDTPTPTTTGHEHRNKASQYNSIKLNNLLLNQQANNNRQPPPPSGGGPGGVTSLTAVQTPGTRQPPNQPQQIGLNNYNPAMSPPMGSGGGAGGINNQQQPLNSPLGNLGAPGNNKNTNNQQNSVVNFMPASPGEDFELTERQERELQENLTNWLAVMYQRDPLMTRSLGHQFDDMILRCTMKSINCTRQRSFENSFSPTEGNCFTFKSRIKRKVSSNQMTIQWDTYEEANLAGTNDGLELVLNLEKNEYISGSSQVGALVMIHHPSDLGYAASEATFIAPEFTTYIGLKMVNISRLPAPYPESCVDSWPAKFADTLTRNSTYSQQACLKICLQKTIQSHCNCQSAFLPIVELSSSQQQQQQQQQQFDSTSTTTVTPPSTTSEPLDIISSPFLTMTPPSSSFVSGSGGADRQARTHANLGNGGRITPTSHGARLRTKSALLKAASSSNGSSAATVEGQQPKQSQQRIIICDTRKRATRQCVREVNLRAADRVHSCECPAKCGVIRYDKTISMARWPTREDKVSFDRGKLDVNFQNLAKVIVYFQTMTCEEVQQQPVFNAAKLFSSLGGIMGMYVGFSFLSVFEIFEVMSRKFWHYLTLRYRSRRFS